MPFSALLDGQPVIALLMSDEQWQAAKAVTKAEEERLLVGFTRLPGFARTSALGLRHFAHRKGYAPDYEWSESAEHLALKAELVRTIAAQGWEVDTEVPSGSERDWIADVLAWNGDERIAFEVQWSKQSAAEYVRRTRRYAEAGIECVWFARHLPKLDSPDVSDEVREAYAAVPIFPLQQTEQLSALIANKDMGYPQAMLASVPTVSKGVAMGQRILQVGELASAVLQGQIRVRNTFSVIVYAAECHRCKHAAAYWLVEGVKKRIPYERPERESLIIAGVHRAVEILDPRLELARLGGEDGTARWKKSEFTCPHCGALQDRSLEVKNLVVASRTGRGLRFEVPASPRWDQFLSRWELTPQRRVKMLLGQ